MSSAIVVQCFAKPDTLAGLCASLLQCEGTRDFHLIFWSDAPGAGHNAERHAAQNLLVKAQLAAFITDNQQNFASVSLLGNERNLGTCATCAAALNYAFAVHEFVIFTEDDTVFARDALQWFTALHELAVLDRPEILALAGESIYFDARAEALAEGYAARAAAAAGARGLTSDYVQHNFVPSTCFATTRAKWGVFGGLRGQPRGDEDVCQLCREQDLHCVFPVVARVKDVGMLHADGYSVAVLGAENVREIKNTYLMADDLPARQGAPRPYAGSLGRLFEESVKMAGFDQTLPIPAARPAARAWQLWCFSLRNFGDALTPYILSRYGVPFELVSSFEAANLLGIGSNLDRVRHDNAPIVIWSAGFMYPKSRPVRYGPNTRFLGVRGHDTEAAIVPARPADLAIGDGGLLVGSLFGHGRVTKKYDIGIIPHMSDVRAAASLGLPGWAGAKIIDVLAPLEQVLQDIAACRRIASSSLHGIVTADAFGIPSCYAVFEGGRVVEGDGFKYADYASALGYGITRVEVGAGTTRDGLIAAIDQIPPRPLPPAETIGDLEMTLQVLRAGVRGLCII